jgi:hypothetical protein
MLQYINICDVQYETCQLYMVLGGLTAAELNTAGSDDVEQWAAHAISLIPADVFKVGTRSQFVRIMFVKVTVMVTMLLLYHTIRMLNSSRRNTYKSLINCIVIILD